MINIYLIFLIILNSISPSWLMSANFKLNHLEMSMIMVTAVSMYCLTSSTNSFSTKTKTNTYLILISGLLICSVLFFISQDLFVLLVLAEMVSFLSMLIFYGFSKDSDKMSSMSFLFLMNVLGSIPFMVFISQISTNSFAICSGYLVLCSTLMFLIKTPTLFLHIWLTKAHVSAFGFMSILLAGILMKLGSLGLIKVSKFLSMINLQEYTGILLSLSIWGMIMVSFVMVRFLDLKYLIAASSVSHMGLFSYLALFQANLGTLGAIYMTLGHTVVSVMMFWSVTYLYEQAQSRSIDSYSNLQSADKTFFMMFVLIVLMNLGVPPFILFLSELMMMSAMVKVSIFSSILFLIVLMISVMYAIGIITKSFKGNKSVSHSIKTSTQIIMMGLFFFINMTIIPVLL